MDNMTYEMFIRNAWKCDRFQKGANTDTWESLAIREYQLKEALGKPTESKAKKAFDKEFTKVLGYVNNAYDNVIKRVSKNEELTDKILDLKNKANQSNHAATLFPILKESLDLLIDNGLGFK